MQGREEEGLAQWEAVEKRPCLEGRTNKISLAWRWGWGAREKSRATPQALAQYQEERSGRGASDGWRSECGEDQELVFEQERAGSWLHESCRTDTELWESFSSTGFQSRAR